ncbi:hypothetical protein [Candidatus Lokiarchaeum ossiferum]|uniref:hypothetical protein n=1 Tax=Candidatus Lokiarchaeum ossiferum TaxID=2951803 RepID=UPI00352C9DBA
MLIQKNESLDNGGNVKLKEITQSFDLLTTSKLLKNKKKNLFNQGINRAFSLHYDEIHNNVIKEQITMSFNETIFDVKENLLEETIEEMIKYFFFSLQMKSIIIIRNSFSIPLQTLLEEFGDFFSKTIEIKKKRWLDYQGCFFTRKSIFDSNFF